MSVIHEIPPSFITAAIEQSFAAFTSAYVRAGHGEVHEEPELTWVATGSPLSYFNGVIHTALTTSDADAKIEEVLDSFKTRNQLMSWWVGPSSSLGELPQRLEAHGLAFTFQDVGMALELSNLKETFAMPAGLVIERVKDAQTLQTWLHTLGLGYDLDERILVEYSKLVTSVPRDQHLVGPFYLARLHGEPVATSALCCAAGVAGIYEVCTVPSARGRGIGAAITRAPLLDARDMGYRIAVLQASKQGKPVYQRHGFTPYCTLDAYCWRPAVG